MFYLTLVVPSGILFPHLLGTHSLFPDQMMAKLILKDSKIERMESLGSTR